MVLSRSGTAVTLVGIVAMTLGWGCSRSPSTRVFAYPMENQTPAQQAEDQAICEQWAAQASNYRPERDVAVGTGVGALAGAAGGALTGAAVGALTGSAGTGAAAGAILGGVGGGAGGGAYKYEQSREGYARAFAACMGARGYSVSVE